MFNTDLAPFLELNKKICHLINPLIISMAIVATASAQNINLLTYNVYFDDKSGGSRYPKILNWIKQEDYNVIALQECTPKFIALLQKDKDLGSYTISKGSMRDGYTNLVLTSMPIKSKGNINTPSNMGRSAPYIVLRNGLKIISVHLESGIFDSNIRTLQIKKILTQIKQDSYVIIAGDFNFDDGDKEEALFSEYTDLGSQLKKVTYDVDNNSLAQQTKYFFESSKRLDRVLMKCKICQLNSFTVQVKNSFSDHWPIKALMNTIE